MNIKPTLAIIASILVLQTTNAQASEAISADTAKSFLQEHVTSWINDATVIDALKAQNEKHAELDESAIIDLDKKWRAEDQDLISATTGNALSSFLQSKQNASEGMFTEIFVMDNKGLNVGQSALTSDYWQGDEAKWQQTFSIGDGAVHVSDVEFDESSQTYQVQISTTISDEGQPIGAVTFGVDAEFLE